MTLKYKLMLAVAFVMAIISSLLTAFGMMDLFAAAGTLILILFIVIDLGRFLLFNFVVDEWKNLRKIKYFVVIILSLLFLYSAVGIYSKMTSLITEETKQALINVAAYNTEMENAYVKKDRSEDLASIARKEYDESIKWNQLDYTNCITRAQNSENIAEAENKCNNTKSRLDKKASNTLKEALKAADTALTTTQEAVKQNTQNKSEIAAVLTTICKMTGGDCNTYDGLYTALSIIIFLVIIGTDYLQIAIVLSINTRKNKLEIVTEKQIDIPVKKVLPKPQITSETHIFRDVGTANLFMKGFVARITKNGKLKKLGHVCTKFLFTGNIEKNSMEKTRETQKELRKKYKTEPPIPFDRLFSKGYFGPKPRNK